MVRVAGEHGVAAATCLAGTGLDAVAIGEPGHEIQGQQELAVLRNILGALPPELPFALRAGQHYHVTSHGMWGFAVLACSSFRDAIETGLRYFELSYSFNRVSFAFEGRRPRLDYDDADNPEDLRAALVERDIAALVAMYR